MHNSKVIFSEGFNKDHGGIAVTIGRWDTVPTGLWCALPSLEDDRQKGGTYANDGPCSDVRTPPHMSGASARWWTIQHNGTRMWLTLRSWTLAKFHRTSGQRHATPEDQWSSAFQHSTGDDSFFLTHEDPDARVLYKLHQVISKASKVETTALEEALAGIIGADAAYVLIAPARQEAQRRAQERAQQAAETAALTKSNAAKGGNPKSFKAGDRVITITPCHFRGGEVHQTFWFVPSAIRPQEAPGFYTEIDTAGLGSGVRYKPHKKDVRRVCPLAFEESTTISAHTRLMLLADQQAVEEARMRAKREQAQSSIAA